jgi:signal transduction histidine kinase
MNASAPATDLWALRWQRFARGSMGAFHAYANWLVRISWRRFIVLSALLLAIVGIVHDSPPFTWRYTEEVEIPPRRVRAPAPTLPSAPAPPTQAPASPAPAEAPAQPAQPGAPADAGGLDISIDKDGIRITPRTTGPAVTPRPAEAADASVSAASAASAAESAMRNAAEAAAATGSLRITLPPGATADAVREALNEARAEINAAVSEARREAEMAMREAEDARREAADAMRALADEPRTRTRTNRIGIGDAMMQFAVLWVMLSLVIKITYTGRMQAEVKAAQATETAEAESLKRQVVEARMAAMQAQVEPHFLFNTLASIDHLIETDPPRASQMQKNLIALLRASMPTMREASGNGAGSGVRDLGREISVIRPYLEILKVRMEERLTTRIDVPDGLLSAEFPPMMMQTLVENAIKHGLEPKAEGGHLRVAAEIVHGKLAVTVADTGLGFGKAATAGTGVGLANIRERLQMLYGPKAVLTVAENQPSGTLVTITVPYRTVEGAPGANRA